MIELIESRRMVLVFVLSLVQGPQLRRDGSRGEVQAVRLG